MPSSYSTPPLPLLIRLTAIVALCLHCVSAQSSSTTPTPPTAVPVFNPVGCSSTKGCLFKPKGCTPHINCSYALSYRSDSQRVYLELLGAVPAAQNSYLAVGFSSDPQMGDDSVTECSSFNGPSFTGRLSYNPGHSNRRVGLSSQAQAELLTTHYAGYSNGLLYCRLFHMIAPATTESQTDVRPLSGTQYLLMASGTTTGSTDINPHSFSGETFPMVSDSPLSLTQFPIPSQPADFQVDPNTASTGSPVGGGGTPPVGSGNGTVSSGQTPAPGGGAIVQPDGFTKAHGNVTTVGGDREVMDGVE